MFLSKAYLLIREKIHWPYTERIIQHTFLFLPHIPDYYRSRIVTWLSTWTQVKSFFISKLTSHQLWWTTFRVSCYLRNTAGTYWCYAIYYIRINISVAVHYKDHILTLYIYIYIRRRRKAKRYGCTVLFRHVHFWCRPLFYHSGPADDGIAPRSMFADAYLDRKEENFDLFWFCHSVPLSVWLTSETRTCSFSFGSFFTLNRNTFDAKFFLCLLTIVEYICCCVCV